MHRAWFFAHDVSMADWMGHFEDDRRGLLVEFRDGPGTSPATFAARPPEMVGILQDEEPQWPTDRYFSGNDVY